MAGISRIRLALRSILYYRWAHLTVILGTAVSTMVITGTLLVGDSVESSLEETVDLRLGRTAFLISAPDRYSGLNLAHQISQDLGIPGCPVLQVPGIASSQGGSLRVNSVDVHGINQDFRNMVPTDSGLNIPLRNEALVSENLAVRLNLSVGDFFLVRVDRISLVPKNAPFVSDEDNQISIRLKVTGILDRESLGRFNLKAAQTAPFNVFVSLDLLNEEMGLADKANRLLFAGEPGVDADQILESARKNWTLDDTPLQLNGANQQDGVALSSSRIFIDSAVIGSVKKIDPEPEMYLTYFANSIQLGSKSTPYSFISAGPFRHDDEQPGKGEILINSWLAEDLGARPGDTLLLRYFVIGPLRNLIEKDAVFRVKAIVPMKGDFADQALMPDIPGLTDAGNCSDWQTGIPIDLDKIRKKDEDYWDEWKGTPKAFVSYEAGRSLWENRFGSATLIRFTAGDDPAGQLTALLGPEDFGFTVNPVREKGLESARGGVDFSQLFMGLSFFLLVGGLTLLALLYNLHLENRTGETGTLRAMGFTKKSIRNILLLEGFMIAIPGILLGAVLAVLYNKVIFMGLNTVWSEIVRTSVLQETVEPATLLTGISAGLLITMITMMLNIRMKLKAGPADLQRKIVRKSQLPAGRWITAGAWIALAASVVLLIQQLLLSNSLQTGFFFISGGLLLLALLLFAVMFFTGERRPGQAEMTAASLVLNNLHRKPSRSIRIVLLFAVGTFVIVSTGLNQKDLYSGASDPTSGTGGFLFYGETTIPVLHELNDETFYGEDGHNIQPEFVQMRKNEGDDASCLNLNRIEQPRILAFPAEKLAGRFTFVRKTDDLDEAHPWISLKKSLPGGVIPAVADQTVIQWGLGLKVGDTLSYTDEYGRNMKLKLVGGLANSIFQGNVLIDESHFLKHFPSSSGTHVMLVEGNFGDAGKAAEILENSLRNYGLDLTRSADRLARFNQVENTYLSIFMLLGGLGMILGTIGLGISLARNLNDRKQELGLLRAIGFPDHTTLSVISKEHLLLLAMGTCIGSVSAFLAILPSLISDFVEASWQTALIILLIILLNGLLWILLVTWHFLQKRLIDALRVE